MLYSRGYLANRTMWCSDWKSISHLDTLTLAPILIPILYLGRINGRPHPPQPFPFWVQGTQVRVYTDTVKSGNELANALVYRLRRGNYWRHTHA